MAMRVTEADRILEELPPLKRGLAVQMRVIEAILVSHRPELPPAEVDARIDMVKMFHGPPTATAEAVYKDDKFSPACARRRR